MLNSRVGSASPSPHLQQNLWHAGDRRQPLLHDAAPQAPNAQRTGEKCGVGVTCSTRNMSSMRFRATATIY